MSFHIGITKLHAEIPHETLTFLEEAKNALSPRMFNIFLCFFVFYIHTELISSQYMPGSRISQSHEQGLRLRRKTEVPQLFPPRRPSVPVSTEVHGHRGKLFPPAFLLAPYGARENFSPAMILPYGSAHARPISGKSLEKLPWKAPRPVNLPPRLFSPTPCVSSGIPGVYRKPDQ